MARVEIEERAWSDPNLKRICVRAKITRSYAMGLLATLWHDSQEEMRTIATAEDLSIWFADDIEKGVDAISILEASGYLEKMPDGERFRISGNFSRIQRVKAYKARGKNGADARWGNKKQRNHKHEKNASSMLEHDAKAIANIQHATCNIQHATHSSSLRSEDSPLRLRSEGTPRASHQPNDHQGASWEEPARDQINDQLSGDNLIAALQNGELKFSDINMSLLNADDYWQVAALKAQHECPEKYENLEDDISKCESRPQISPDQENASELKLEAPSDVIKKPAEKKKKLRKKAAASEPTGTQELIAHFMDNWKASHGGADYPLDGKDAAAAKRIVKAVGLERAKIYASHFLRMQTRFYIDRQHPLWALANDLPKVAQFASNGRLVTSIAAKSDELDAHNRSMVDAYLIKKGIIDPITGENLEKKRKQQEREEIEIEHTTHTGTF